MASSILDDVEAERRPHRRSGQFENPPAEPADFDRDLFKEPSTFMLRDRPVILEYLNLKEREARPVPSYWWRRRRRFAGRFSIDESIRRRLGFAVSRRVAALDEAVADHAVAKRVPRQTEP